MIRRYGSDDLKGCAEVFRAAFAAEPWNEIWPLPLAETRISELMDTPLSVGFVLEENGKICGFAAGRAVTYLYGREYVIDEFCIAPEMQGRGAGSAVLRQIAAEMRAEGCVSIVLQTTKGYPSEKFYLKNGFQHSENMITMWRSLRDES